MWSEIRTSVFVLDKLWVSTRRRRENIKSVGCDKGHSREVSGHNVRKEGRRPSHALRLNLM